MIRLIDTSLWIDLTRKRSSAALRAFVSPHVNDPDARLAEPIVFELLRSASDAEVAVLTAYFASVPVIAGSDDLWRRAAELGRDCRKAGCSVSAMDLLIAQIAIDHGAELTTFDADFLSIAASSTLQVNLLQRPKS